MNFYSITSKEYDVLDKTYFAKEGGNPRKVIESMIPDTTVKILDLCCGTLSNSLSIAEKYPNAKIMGVDLSKEMLQVARKKTRKKQLSIVYLKCSDATNLDIKDNTFKSSYTKEELLIPDLLVEKEGPIEIYYAPHNEYLNPDAKVFIVGITPGFQQMSTAIAAARKGIAENKTIPEIQYDCKAAARFSGSMRRNIIHMLDEIGLNQNV